MKPVSKILSSVILFIVISIGGCLFLMKGCLEKYDEYSQFDEVQVFKNEKGAVIVFLKEIFKVNSYSSDGGSTNISGTSHFYLETRDASTLRLIKCTEFEKVDNPVKNRPHIIGRDNQNLWIYQGKIIAFNPYTHEVVCNSEKLEDLNPELKNNLPDDIKYYHFNYILGRMEITSKNANHFQIASTFKAQQIKENDVDKNADLVQLNLLSIKLKAQMAEIQQKGNYSNLEYYKIRDSLRVIDQIIRKKEYEFRYINDYNVKIQEYRTRGFGNSYEIMVNATIVDTSIYALLSEKELMENTSYFNFHQTQISDVQRMLYKARFSDLNFSSGFPGNCKISDIKPVNNNISFLNGGFLQNKTTRKTIQLFNPLSWLIVSAKEVGNKSKLIIQRVNFQGFAIWTKELPLINFSDMALSEENLILFSNDGVKITDSSNCNWILSLNLKTGAMVFLDLANEENN